VLVRNQQRMRPTRTFARALSMATGDLVFLSDQDDVWLPGKISTVVRLQAEHPEKLAFMNDAEICRSDLASTGLTKLGQLGSAGYSPDAFVMGCCTAVRRELLELCLPIPDDIKGHDNWLVGFSNRLGATIIVHHVLQLYRRHGANESNVLPNRTTPVGRLSRARVQIHRALSPERETAQADEIWFSTRLHEALARSAGRCGGRYDSAIRAAISKQQEHVNCLLYRRQLRQKFALLRLPAVLHYWITGGYRNANGYRSAMRDVLG